ncbi:MAG TPA: hydrogenase maturation nickel metallochaperone HypA [Solirubrobacteraceae bacterium]|nr:hydrogenase maturation nickel metallochaperone HypA [Solirubrobacteraceae bacterium]
MHELSLCRSIVAITVGHAQGRPVAIVRVRVGHLRQVVPDTLERCFELLAPASGLEGAVLEIIEVPAEVRCRGCGATTVLERFELRCGACGGSDLEVVAGEELLVDSLELAD